MELEEAIKKIEENTKKSEENARKIEKNLERIQQNTGAIEVLHTIKTYNNRFFIMWILTFFALLLSLGYNFYLLNDIGVVETTSQEIEQNNDSGSNNYIGNDGEINIGKTDNKTN